MIGVICHHQNMSTPQISLVRVTRSEFLPTYGVLLFSDKPICLTLELPDRGNQHNISCIPAAKYKAVKVKDVTTKGGMWIEETLQVADVPDRSGILFHVGNSMVDTEGCIILGMEFGGQGLLYSKVAMSKFIDAIFDPVVFDLEIRWAA